MSPSRAWESARPFSRGVGPCATTIRARCATLPRPPSSSLTPSIRRASARGPRPIGQLAPGVSWRTPSGSRIGCARRRQLSARRLLDLEASLLGTLRDFKVAQERLTLLVELYRSAGEDHLAGRALVTQALYTFYQGNTEAAYTLLQEGISLVDTNRDPSLLSVIAHNRLLILVECGRYREAKRLLFDLRSQRESEGRIARLKLRGIEGEIRYGLEEYASAEIIFREVREGFKEIGLSFACALEGLFLATALMRQGKTEESMKESLSSAGIFLSLNIHREILSTVLLLQEALERGQMSVTVLETTTRFLRRKQLELGI
jgi:tetratricopeptide (TPR) repeat protein